MKKLREIKTVLQNQKAYLRERYGIVEISLFGSFVRNEQDQESDIDILVDFEGQPDIDLLDLVNLERYLSELLDTDVDVAIKSSLRKRVGQRILNEAVSL